MVGVNQDWDTKGDGVHGASVIDDPHITLMLLQLHISLVPHAMLD